MSGSRRLIITAFVAIAAVVAAVVGIVFATRDEADETVTATVSPAPPTTPSALPDAPVWGFLRADAAAAQVGQVQRAAAATQAGSWQDTPASADEQASVERSAPGRYTVTYPKIGVPGGLGAAIATAIGGPASRDAVHCHVVDWDADGADERLDVACRNAQGAETDSAFTALFTYAPESHRIPELQPYAYFRNDKPEQQRVEPDNAYSFTEPGSIEINRIGPGHYSIDLIGKAYARTGNSMLVNAVGDTPAGCNALGREAKADRQTLFVGCALGRERTDTPFVLVYGNQHGMLPVEDYPFGHAFTGITVGGSQIMQPPVGEVVDAWLRYSANSAGRTNTVRRLEVGRYEVTFPGIGLAPDHIQVTPYGEPTARCMLDGWTSAPAGTTPIDVTVSFHCVGPDGNLADSFASVAYVSATPGALLAPPREPELPPALTSPTPGATTTTGPTAPTSPPTP